MKSSRPTMFEQLEPRLLLNGDASLLGGVPVDPPSVENLFVPCDVNFDGVVDGADLAVWQEHHDPLGLGDNTYFHGDTNCDGLIDGQDLALWQENYNPLGVSTSGEYAWFNGFCIDYFGAENEQLVYETFGTDLAFVEDGSWEYVSVQSACIAFETSLPAYTYVAFGETSTYGGMSVPSERPFYIHVHYLRNLEPETEYQYRLVAMDERGNILTSDVRTFTTGSLAEVMSIATEHLAVPMALDQSGATYVLTTDVVADSTAFNVMAPNITLDLNGHTVTYDNVAGAYDPTATPANFPDWMRLGPHGVRAGWSADGARLVNGYIVQGEGDAGEGANPIVPDDFSEIAGVTVVYHGAQVTGIYGDAAEVHHNVLLDRGTVVTDRHNGIFAIQAAGAPVHHNLVKRCRQNGIKVYDDDEVQKNEVYVDSWATNSFGIMCFSHANSTIHDNWVFGGGYDVIAIGTAGSATHDVEVYDNFVHLQATEPTLRWDEYGAQSMVKGMRITWGGSDVYYHDNVMVISLRDGGWGRGIWYCPDPNITGVVFENNIIKAFSQNAASNVGGAVVINGWSETNSAPVTIQNNRVISNFCNVLLGDVYGGGTNAVFIANTFVKMGDRANYRTIQIGYDWQVCSGHRFIDSEFEGGASYDEVLWLSGNTRNYTVEWTLTVNTEPYADVTVEDAGGTEVFSGQANAAGVASVVLVQYLAENGTRTYHTPHSVTATGSGWSASTSVTMDSRKEITLGEPAGEETASDDVLPTADVGDYFVTDIMTSGSSVPTLGIPRWKMFMDPDDSSRMYAVISDNHDQLFLSLDGGHTWTGMTDVETYTYDYLNGVQIDGYLDYHAALASSGDGNLFVTYPSYPEIYYRRISSPATSSTDVGPEWQVPADLTINKRSNILALGSEVWVFTRTSNDDSGNVRYFRYDQNNNLLDQGWVSETERSRVRIGSTDYQGNPLVVIWYQDAPTMFKYFLWNGTSFVEPPYCTIWNAGGSASTLTREYTFVVAGDVLHVAWSLTATRLRHAWRDLSDPADPWHYDDIVDNSQQQSYGFYPILTSWGDDAFVFFTQDHNNNALTSDIYCRRWDGETNAWVTGAIRITFDGSDVRDPNTTPHVNPNSPYIPVMWFDESTGVVSYTALPSQLGDTNGDGMVDGVDLASWQENYDPMGMEENSYWMGDWNADGLIDGVDLAIWQDNYNPLGLVGAATPAASSLATVDQQQGITLVASLGTAASDGLVPVEGVTAPAAVQQHRVLSVAPVGTAVSGELTRARGGSAREVEPEAVPDVPSYHIRARKPGTKSEPQDWRELPTVAGFDLTPLEG